MGPVHFLKRKVYKKYAFGNNLSLAETSKGSWIVGTMSFWG
jgi:hypothetical protein